MSWAVQYGTEILYGYVFLSAAILTWWYFYGD